MFNPWFLFGALLSLFIAFGTGHHQGYKSGVNAQKVADQQTIDAANTRAQGIIDGYNIQIAQQKAEANQKYREAAENVIAQQHQNDLLKSQLEKQHVQNQITSNRLRDAYAAYSLRFRAEEDRGRWNSAGSTESAQGAASGDASPAYCVVSREVDAALKSIAYDCDTLKDDYKLLYDWAHITDGIP